MPSLIEIGLLVLEKEDFLKISREEAKNVQKFTDDVQRRTKTDRNRSPE
jgi:hypothetical protein